MRKKTGGRKSRCTVPLIHIYFVGKYTPWMQLMEVGPACTVTVESIWQCYYWNLNSWLALSNKIAINFRPQKRCRARKICFFAKALLNINDVVSSHLKQFSLYWKFRYLQCLGIKHLNFFMNQPIWAPNKQAKKWFFLKICFCEDIQI